MCENFDIDCDANDLPSQLPPLSSSGKNDEKKTYTAPKSYRMLRTEFKNAKELIHSTNNLERVGKTPEIRV